MDANSALIRLEHISKRFGGVTALDGVSFTIARGEVHALVGENGAGKSTLMKILAGVYQADSGSIELDGKPAVIKDPVDARRHGVSIVFQELNLFPHLTVAGNIFANRELVSAGLLDERTMNKEAQRVLDSMGVTTISPKTKVGKLAVSERQLVEIARTLQQESGIIIMDEPNSALTQHETERLFDLIRRLRDEGITTIYVSHRLEEVFSIADRISVLRDGQYQGTWRIADTSIPQIVEQMIGRRLEESFPVRQPLPADRAVVLRVNDLTKEHRLGPISFEVRAGEILGFAGLEGSGVDDVFRILFGLDEMTTGKIVYRDSESVIRSPAEAIKQGWGLIPANRREQGLMMDWSIRKNTTLVILDQLLSRLGLISRTADRNKAEEYVRRLDVATDSVDKKVINLSGGNQQKVVVAKWLASGPKLLILNDPTRGIDVGAKSEIYHLCSQLAEQGLALLFSSSEIDEIVGLSDRILAFYKGQVLTEFPGHTATKSDIMRVIAGGATGNRSN